MTRDGILPADEDNDGIRESRISSWKDRTSPEGYAFPGDPLKREQNYPVAELSGLGKRILGLERW
jgi:hypothetical protein